MFFRAVVPDAHTQILPCAHGEFGYGRAVKLADKPLLRIQARICPCDVRAVGLVAAAVLALVFAVLIGLIAGLVVSLGALVLVLALVLFRHSYHLTASMPRLGHIMRGFSSVSMALAMDGFKIPPQRAKIFPKYRKNALTFPGD